MLPYSRQTLIQRSLSVIVLCLKWFRQSAHLLGLLVYRPVALLVLDEKFINTF